MRKVALWALAASFAAGSASLAQPPSGQWYLIHQEVAKPSQVELYEAGTKEFAALVQANRAAMPTFHFTALQGEDFTYTYVLPIKSFASVDTVLAEFGAAMQSAGPKFAELNARTSSALDHFSEFVVGEEPSMGYLPAAPRLKPEEATFFRYTFYYLIAGKEEDAKAIAADFNALYKSKNIADGYKIYWAVTGADLPLLVVEQWAKDEADFHASEARNMATLGDAAGPINARALAITRRVDHASARKRPDLSLPNPAKK